MFFMIQEHLGPAGYVKIPTVHIIVAVTNFMRCQRKYIFTQYLFSFLFIKDLQAYEKGCKFLPRLNNELEDDRNATYKERFSSLNKLVLIMVGL